jgi:hypothetical protein
MKNITNIILLNQINIYKTRKKMLTSIMTNRHIMRANKIVYKILAKIGITIPKTELQIIAKHIDYKGQEASDQINAAILENKP